MASQKILMKVGKIVFYLFVALCLGGCVTYFGYDGPYEGKVIDPETNQPIEGAVVHGTWVKSHPGPGGASSTYFDSREVLTDKEGRFKIDGVGLLILSNMEEMEINIFKAGYTQIHGYWSTLTQDVERPSGKATIKLHQMTLEERKKRNIYFPGMVPIKSIRLFTREYNKETLELGYPTKMLLPEE
ncbi:MAG: hypothetical protein WCP20_22240 [Desulfuromonadales bacterium]